MRVISHLQHIYSWDQDYFFIVKDILIDRIVFSSFYLWSLKKRFWLNYVEDVCLWILWRQIWFIPPVADLYLVFIL